MYQVEDFSVWIFQNLPKEALEDWAAVDWSVWNARNKMVFEDGHVFLLIYFSSFNKVSRFY